MRRSSILILGIMVLGSGCLGTDDSNDDVAAPADSARARLLYRDNVGADHTLEYHALGGGTLAVRETLSIDGNEAPLLDEVGHAESLAAVFQRVHPTTAIPRILVDADRDSTAQRERRARMPSPDVSALLPRPETGASATTCSADFYGDNWGATWFLNGYCNTGNFRECNTNWGWFDNWHQTSWNSYRQFEGDFSTNGHIGAYYWDCFWSLFTGTVCYWIQSMDHDLLPRHVESWTTTGSDGGWVRFLGNSPCGHLGVAFLWNS